MVFERNFGYQQVPNDAFLDGNLFLYKSRDEESMKKSKLQCFESLDGIFFEFRLSDGKCMNK